MSVPLFALATLLIGSIGLAVSRLHVLLRKLGYSEIPNDEAEESSYGPGTRAMVRRLQEELNIAAPNPGEVDAATAQAVNLLLFEQRIFYRVAGRVVDPEGRPIAGLAVRVTDGDNLAGIWCAEAVTNADGAYQAFYDPTWYTGGWDGIVMSKDFVDPVVSAHARDGHELARSDRHEHAEDLRVDLEVERPVVRPDGEQDGFRVRGTVVDRDGRPLEGIRLEIFDRDIGTFRDHLGTVETDPEGAFELRYSAEAFAAEDAETPAGKSADLIFVLYRGEEPIEDHEIVRLPVSAGGFISSPVPVPEDEKSLGIVARLDELVRIRASGLRAGGQSEFDRLIAALAPLTERVPLVGFDEAKSRDVTFAAREVGESVERVADLVLAHRLVGDRFDNVPAAAFYGLARHLGARDARAFATHSVAELATTLQAAIEALTIPGLDDPAELAARLHGAAVKAAIRDVNAGASGSIDEVIAAVIEDPDKRVTLIANARNAATGAQFWSELSASNPDFDVEDLKYTLQLGTLTANNKALVAALKAEAPTARSVRELALNVGRERIAALVAEVGGVPGGGDNAEAIYVSEIAGLMESAHPTAVVARLAENWSEQDRAAVPASTVALLNAAVRKTTFDLVSDDFDELVASNDEVLFEGMNDGVEKEAAIEGVRRIARLFKVSADPGILGKLTLARSSNGLPFHGALDIARYSKSAFVGQIPGVTEGDSVLLSYVHDRSRAIADTVANLVVGGYQDENDVLPAGAFDMLSLTEAEGDPPAEEEGEGEGGAGAVVTPVVDWNQMFGGAEMCDCDDCRSVTGPAAYLVDLFEFLDKRCLPNAAGVTPLDVLIGHPNKSLTLGGPPGIVGRRPDLAHIKLTCENTNTTIPTIDLINEILETLVASGGDVPLKSYESSPGVTGAELSAAPENVSADAYAVLGGAVFPMSLPYDRLLVTARIQLKHGGTSRAEVIDLFATADAAAKQAAWTAEFLGLFRGDYEILTGKTFAGVDAPVATADLFGGGASWVDRVANVRALLKAFEISFVQLVELVRTRFVGGEVPTGNASELMSRIFLDVDQLKAIRAPGFVLAPDSEEAKALALGGLTLAEVQSWLDARADRLSTTIVLQPPIGCSPDEMWLRHLDASLLAEEAEWLALHRFVRLAKRMQVSFSDLDVLLSAVGGSARPTFTADLLDHLARLGQLKAMLDVPWPVAASLVADISTHGTASLYDTLFPPLGLARIHPEFRRGPEGAPLTVDRPVADGYAGLGAVLSMSVDKLAGLATALGVAKLTIGSASAIHRAAVLAKALAIEPVELGKLVTATGGVKLTDTAALTPDVVLSLVARVKRLRTIGGTSDILDLLANRPSKAGRSDEAITALRSGLNELLDPLHQLDDADRREEADRATAGSPFSDEEIAARKAAGEVRRRSAVLTYVSGAFDLSAQVVSRLLVDATVDGAPRPALLRVDDAPAISLLAARRAEGADVGPVVTLLHGLDRIAVVVLAADLDAAGFLLSVGDAAVLPVSAIATIPGGAAETAAIAAALEALPALVRLATETRRPAAFAAAVRALANRGWVDATFAAVASWLDRSAELVAAVPRAGVAALDDAQARKAPVAALDALGQRLRVMQRVPMPVADLVALTTDPVTPQALKSLTSGVSSRHARSSWLDLSRQLSDPIRQQSRDALVAFLLQREGLGSAEELFDLLYIDPGINPFVLTARIRQAMFAVQIYVVRCLMGFERASGVEPEQIDVEEWKTISRQPVWAARCKTLTNPEDLLEPSWRDNKSPAFKTFESTVGQGDVTPVNAEMAYRTLLSEFSMVSALEVMGTYLQETFEGREALYFKSVLHVVGRSRGGAVRKYFYRRLNRYQHHEEWTNWEPIEVEIEGIDPDRQEARDGNSGAPQEAGVHVLPVAWRGQVYLFWPTFRRKVDQPPPQQVDLKVTPTRSNKYWDVKLNWTTRQPSGWAPPQQSSVLFETWWYKSDEVPLEWDDDGIVDYWGAAVPHTPRNPDPSQFVLKANPKGETLDLILATRSGATGPMGRAWFTLARTGEMTVFGGDGGGMGGDHFRMLGSSKASASFMGFRARGDIKVVATAKKPDGEKLFSTSEDMRFTTLNQFYQAQFNAPMFLDLDGRSYLAQPSLGSGTIYEQVTEPEFKPDLGIQTKPWDLAVVAPLVASSSKPVKNPWVAAMVSDFTPLYFAETAAKPDAPIWADTVSIDKIGYLGPTFRAVDVPALNLSVTPFHHPFADEFVEVVRRDGLPALLTPGMQKGTVPANRTFSKTASPNKERVTAPASEGMDFAQSTPYGNYNWELFFHAPVTLVTKLAENGQHEAAIELLHQSIYTPFATDPEGCWRFEGLRNIDGTRLETMLSYLSLPDGDPRKQNVLAQIDAMRLHPFQAHRIARLRPLAYRKWVVALDVKLHVAAGDKLLSAFTPESVNQAFPFYLIAAREMGKKPETIPQRATLPAMSYAELRPNLNAMGNVMFALESKLGSAVGSSAGGGDAASTGVLQRGAIGYFGIPRNDKLLALWDLVADRLYKVRNGMNIEGVQIQLPLYSPQVDPALFAEAVAAGVDISLVYSAITQPLPRQRYAVMRQRAAELTAAVIRLGELLLSTRERRDVEDLARKRATHEKAMSDLMTEMRKRQVEEAEAERDVAQHEEDSLRERWYHFADLLGERPEQALFFVPFQVRPARSLTLVDADKIKFESLSVIPDLAKVGAFLGAGAPGLFLAAADESVSGIRQLSAGKVLQEEQMELESGFEAVKATFDASLLDTLAAVLGIIPNFEAAAKPLGAGVGVSIGGAFFAAAASAKARNKKAAAEMYTFLAGVHRKQAELVLRERTWTQELNEAALGVLQARRRVVVRDIQVDLAQKALKAQEAEAEHAANIETYLKDKFSSTELYEWAAKRLGTLYKQAFTLALETAQMTEASYRAERDEPQTPFTRMAPPADAREELVAGHELMGRLNAMDRAYNAAPRLAEFTRTFSLRQIDPFALYALRRDGKASFRIPELLFDIDHPGYYDRRIKTIEVSIPCVAGPYAPVTGTLTLTGSRRRRTPDLAAPAPDEPVTGASIALSSGRSDSGLFELSMQDPNYLPFEGPGCDSEWMLTMPHVVPTFETWSITDVAVTMRYVAKPGSAAFRGQVEGQLKQALNALVTHGDEAGAYQLVSVRHELPDAWARYKAGQGLAVSLNTDLLPYMLKQFDPTLLDVVGSLRTKSGESVDLKFAAPEAADVGWTIAVDDPPDELEEAAGIQDITLFARFKV